MLPPKHQRPPRPGNIARSYSPRQDQQGTRRLHAAMQREDYWLQWTAATPNSSQLSQLQSQINLWSLWSSRWRMDGLLPKTNQKPKDSPATRLIESSCSRLQQKALGKILWIPPQVGKSTLSSSEDEAQTDHWAIAAGRVTSPMQNEQGSKSKTSSDYIDDRGSHIET